MATFECNNLERIAEQLGMLYKFEPNDQQTRNEIAHYVESHLLANFADAINQLKIVCNETNNTSDMVDRNEVKIDIDINDQQFYISIKPSSNYQYLCGSYDE